MAPEANVGMGRIHPCTASKEKVYVSRVPLYKKSVSGFVAESVQINRRTDITGGSPPWGGVSKSFSLRTFYLMLPFTVSTYDFQPVLYLSVLFLFFSFCGTNEHEHYYELVLDPNIVGFAIHTICFPNAFCYIHLDYDLYVICCTLL
jgi:hypothetical protein